MLANVATPTSCRNSELPNGFFMAPIQYNSTNFSNAYWLYNRICKRRFTTLSSRIYFKLGMNKPKYSGIPKYSVNHKILLSVSRQREMVSTQLGS